MPFYLYVIKTSSPKKGGRGLKPYGFITLVTLELYLKILKDFKTKDTLERSERVSTKYF